METKSIEEKAYAQMKRAFKKFVMEVENLCETPGRNEEWLDSQEVCRLLNIQPRTLQKYRNYRKIPYSIIRGKCYYKSADIEKLITNLKIK